MKLLEKPNSHQPSTRRAREKFPPRTTWRAQKSATAQKSREQSTAFFTGKPYIESLGSYSFLFRNYNPALCRWTTPDPSGFPDGANPNLLGNNAITSGFDPDGLAWKLKMGDSHTSTPSQGDSRMILSPPSTHVTFNSTDTQIDIDISTMLTLGSQTAQSMGKLKFSVTGDGQVIVNDGGSNWYGTATEENFFSSNVYAQVATGLSSTSGEHRIFVKGRTEAAVNSSVLTGIGLTHITGAGINLSWSTPTPLSAKGTFDFEVIAYE